MFNKVKQLGDLAKMRSEAQKLQKELEKIYPNMRKKFTWKLLTMQTSNMMMKL